MWIDAGWTEFNEKYQISGRLVGIPEVQSGGPELQSQLLWFQVLCPTLPHDAAT